MKRFLLCCLLLFALKAQASHIVGGEFEIIHISGTQYRVNLIYYFDVVNNGFGGVPPEGMEPSITAVIYQKALGLFKRNVVLDFVSRTPVFYTQPACSNDAIQTERVLYTTIINLTPAEYNHPNGYYIVWERCCRNYTITNIYSDPPIGNNSLNSAGQTFYLEFPPVVKNGEPFINSSPRLFPPLSDYACPRRPYYTDFAGTDDDGDSLVYSLVTPLTTHQTVAVPTIQPGPYPLVRWKDPFALGNIVGGEPDLKVSQQGFLTVTPTTIGLYVFAVMCEEFRDGIKIGELRRDFQMFVVDGCAPADPPVIKGRPIGAPNFTESTISVSFANTVTDADRCMEVQISDPDASRESDFFKENIGIRVIALNYTGSANFVKLPTITSAVLTNGSTKNFTICFAKCPPFEEGPVQIGIIAFDDACSLPLSDTLRVTVNVDPPTNVDPEFTTADVNQVPPINEGTSVAYPIQAVDGDGDPILVNFLNDGFVPASVGMTINTIQHTNGTYQSQLLWDTRCNVYDFTHKTSFEMKVLIEDQDVCLYPHPDTMTLRLQVKLPGNADPIISTDLVPDESTTDGLVVNTKIFEKLDFNVFGKDLVDHDTLILTGAGVGFNMQDYLISFPGDASNEGDTESRFQWNFTCDNVDPTQRNEFDFKFIVVDNSNKCRFYKADTLNVKVFVDPPDNQKPILTAVNTNADIPEEDGVLKVLVGQQISLGLISDDPDVNPHEDKVVLEMIGAEGSVSPTGYEFADADGIGFAQSTFSWNPDCSIFENGDYTNEYVFTFRTLDDRCFNIKGDTIEVKMVITDVDGGDADFLPPNFISPNGDEFNNFFAMVRENEDTGELENILPRDNCIGRFENIAIYNRWGVQLFQSNDREFRWTPLNEAAGIYYYTLKYTHKEYKGTITLQN
jgi:hypothetical protein